MVSTSMAARVALSHPLTDTLGDVFVHDLQVALP